MGDRDQSVPDGALLNELAGAEHDILSLANRHGLSLEALVDWAERPQTRRALAGLCVLADTQTQLLLSRYRLVAATRLIAQVTAEADALPAEQVRKACVDLLKTELSRAGQLDVGDDAGEDAELDALVRAMSGGGVNDLNEPETHPYPREGPDAQPDETDEQ